MKKVPTLFVRDPATHLVIAEVTPGCEWVQAGEGVATVKWDGTSVLIMDGQMFKRREFKDGQAEPYGYVEAEYDPVTTKHHGWVPVDLLSKEDRWHREALDGFHADPGPLMGDGTYELVGPKVNGNNDSHGGHLLLRHGGSILADVPTDYDDLHFWLMGAVMEGVVWHHPDGRMAKIKRRDYGLDWPDRREVMVGEAGL